MVLEILLQIINEIITAAIVVVTASFLLYNLTRNLRNRVARTSSVVLACVTFAYMGDVFISLDPTSEVYAITLRLQWIAIAFIPSATFHLSDALLATTGLVSRGRRRLAVRVLYIISTIFTVLALLTDNLVEPVATANTISLQGRTILPIFIIFYIVINGVAFINVQRARLRCLTRSTQRRMAYLQVAILMPSLGIFPYSVLLNPGEEFSLISVLLVNTANIIVILMIVFLSYPLSFFGSDQPDRVVKSELLRFFLRGPGTGLLALVVIIFTTQATRIVGLRGEDFMPFAVVAFVLLWQWTIAIYLPAIEKWLIFRDEDAEQIAKLQDLSDKLLTRDDLLQLIEATLEATCDYLRVEVAFVATLIGSRLEILQSIGLLEITDENLQAEQENLLKILSEAINDDAIALHRWNEYWIIPLYSRRNMSEAPIGFMGIEAQSEQIDLAEDAQEMLGTFVERASQTLDDVLLQGEIFAALEGLLPQITMTRSRAGILEYRANPNQSRSSKPNRPDRDEVFEQVRAALRHYWGGAGISHSRLLEWQVVQDEIKNGTDNPVHALREVLKQAIEKQRPEGEKHLNSPEWILYNILNMRFLEQRKVRYVARRLVMSESDLYRKQNAAIGAVTDTLIDTEFDISDL